MAQPPFGELSIMDCIKSLPYEIKCKVLSHFLGFEITRLPFSPRGLVNMVPIDTLPTPIRVPEGHHSASTPPANGGHPLLALPAEIKRRIFSYLLPDSKKVIAKPRKEGERPQPTQRGRETLNLLVLSVDLYNHVADTLYQDTIFRVRVTPRGMYILHYPLMKLDFEGYSIALDTDAPVIRHPNSVSGFNNMQHLDIALWGSPPANGDWKDECLALYFVVQYLVDIRLAAKNYVPLTTLTITFLSVSKAHSYWWDDRANSLRVSAFHDLSMVEMITLPLLQLHGISRVNFSFTDAIPIYQQNHPDLNLWKSKLVSAVTSPKPRDMTRDELLRKSQLQDALISWRYEKKFGGSALKDDTDESDNILAEAELLEHEEKFMLWHETEYEDEADQSIEDYDGTIYHPSQLYPVGTHGKKRTWEDVDKENRAVTLAIEHSLQDFYKPQYKPEVHDESSRGQAPHAQHCRPLSSMEQTLDVRELDTEVKDMTLEDYAALINTHDSPQELFDSYQEQQPSQIRKKRSRRDMRPEPESLYTYLDPFGALDASSDNPFGIPDIPSGCASAAASSDMVAPESAPVDIEETGPSPTEKTRLRARKVERRLAEKGKNKVEGWYEEWEKEWEGVKKEEEGVKQDDDWIDEEMLAWATAESLKEM
ncbi:MAG: hypothetical protein M1820_004043 [Bogoriella megaspora]|nr:MAG: hypothetical protein M1820_004043 [Bogoriella megaspora]